MSQKNHTQMSYRIREREILELGPSCGRHKYICMSEFY